MCPGVFLSCHDCNGKDGQETFHEFFTLDTGCQNQQTFKEKKDKVSSDAFLKECLTFQNVWRKYTGFLLLKTVSGKHAKVAGKVPV